MYLKGHKFKEEAIIPTKEPSAAGFDIYTIEKDVVIPPHSQHLFSTGIGCIIEPGYWLDGRDRGSTGSKGMHIHCGVVDNTYRGEIFICIKNDNPYPVHIGDFDKVLLKTHKIIVHESPKDPNMPNAFLAVDIQKEIDVIDELQYPYTKAIAQLIPEIQLSVDSSECSEEEWQTSFEQSDRKDGKLGSSGK